MTASASSWWGSCDRARPELREIANLPKLIRRLFERLTREGPGEACYEAGVSGYDLYRQLTTLGVPCQVSAPPLTPRRPGQRIKTDQRDARQLVPLFRAGELIIPVRTRAPRQRQLPTNHGHAALPQANPRIPV
jgi:transposase